MVFITQLNRGLIMPIEELVKLLSAGTVETLLMTFISAGIAYAIGIPLASILFFTKPGGLKENRLIHNLIGRTIDVFRSIPYAILIILVYPWTRFFVQTSIGIKATIFTLSISAIPFVTRLVEATLNEVDGNLVETSLAMGATPFQILKEVILVESKVGLIQSAAIALVNIIGFGSVAGLLGGGGLAMISMNYGYYRKKHDIMLWSVVLIVALVWIIQFSSQWIIRKVNHKK